MSGAVTTSKLNPQTVGNVGLYYVCYRLSRAGWNVMPTARNARGIDLLAYSSDGKRTRTIQVKALSKRNPVPLGTSLDHLIADFVVICRHVQTDSPESFVLSPDDVRTLVHKGEKEGRETFWLQPRAYEGPAFRDAWARIGSGFD